MNLSGARRGITSAVPAWSLLAVGLAATTYTAVDPSSLPSDVVYYAVGTLAIAAGWVAIVRRGASRSLQPLLAGATLWLAADWVWWILELAGRPIGFPSWVDGMYLSGYPLALVGVIVVWRRQLASVLGGLLDSAALAAAGALLVWAAVIDPVTHTGESGVTIVTAIAYPAFDAFILIGLVQLLLTPALRRTRALQALAGGVLVYLLSDVHYAYGALRGGYAASWEDAGWLLLYSLWGFAALHPSARTLETVGVYRLPTRPTRIVVLALGCLTAPLAMFIAIRRGTFEPVVFAISMAAILALVFWRMAVIFSEYRHAEAEAEEGREFYRALVENGPDLVMLMDLDGTLLFASPSFERILGYVPGKVVGSTMRVFTEPEDIPIAEAALAAADTGGAIPPFTIRARDRRGAVVWLEVTATMITARGGWAILAQARDVTRRRLAESSLAKTSQTLEALMAVSPAAVVALDREARVTVWSQGASQLFGWTAEETLGRRTPLRSAAELDSDFFSRYFDEGATLEESTRPRKDGTTAEVMLSAAPLRDADGTVTGTIGVFLDIGERRQLEASLRQAQRLESVGQLAGGIAHDFNNLLTAIRGYTYLALERAGDDHELRSSLDEIARAGERATDLTRQLLAFSRRQTLQLTTFDLNRAVGESTSLLSRLLGGHIRIETSFRAGPCGVRADPGQVEQILTNLVVNARDAMAGSGTLTIGTDRTELAADDADTLGLEAGPHVVLLVTDTGKGMDADTVAHAFDPFFTTKPLGQGTGLGLATVYGIVRQSGGAVTIDSTPGSGTSVRVLLPEHRIDPAAAVTAVPAVQPSTPRGSERILLVEDEEAVRRLTAQLLETQGYKVIDAAGPLLALELAAGTAIDLLATDIAMPGMDGTQLAERLWEGRPDLPVLFLSGYPRGAALDGTLGRSGTGFLQKPYSAADLARAIRATLDDRAAVE